MAAAAMMLALAVPAPALAEDANGGSDVGATAQIPVDGGFAPYFWDLRRASGFNIGGPFTYTAPTPTVVIVTDAFLSGDRFRVYDGERVLGTTSTPASGQQVGRDCDAALRSASFSHDAFFLQPGSHGIRIQTIESAPGFTAGQGCIRVARISLELCRQGGWERYGVFKNEGDCISFVATEGRNGAAS